MKKLLVLALAFMMLLSVIACSNPTTSDPTPDPGQTNAEATPAPTDAQGAEETPAAPSAVRKENLVVALQAEPQTIDPYAASHDTTFISSKLFLSPCLSPWTVNWFPGLQPVTNRLTI